MRHADAMPMMEMERTFGEIRDSPVCTQWPFRHFRPHKQGTVQSQNTELSVLSSAELL